MRGLPGQSLKADPFHGFGRLFDVEWLRLQDVVLPEVSYLRNGLDSQPVSACRDGQELSYEAGKELCTHFDVRVYLEDPESYEPCEDQNLLLPPVPGPPVPGPPPKGPPPNKPPAAEPPRLGNCR